MMIYSAVSLVSLAVSGGEVYHSYSALPSYNPYTPIVLLPYTYTPFTTYPTRKTATHGPSRDEDYAYQPEKAPNHVKGVANQPTLTAYNPGIGRIHGLFPVHEPAEPSMKTSSRAYQPAVKSKNKPKKEEEPLVIDSVCVRDSDDHLPSHMAAVLESPQDYILGPRSQMMGDEMDVVIVGGGMSGLTSAHLLLNVGHKVTILEASGRLGGRVFTHYGRGWYGDFGAMRFPQYHLLVMKAFQLFNIPTTLFTNYHQGSQGNYQFINGKYIPDENSTDEKILSELYKAFNVPNEEIPRDKKGKIRDPVTLINEILDDEIKNTTHCKDEETLHHFLRRKCREKGIHENIIIYWSIVSVSTSFLPYSVDEFILDTDTIEIHGNRHLQPYLEIINGSSVLPETMLKSLKRFSKFTYLDNSPVWKIDNTNKKRSLVYYDKDSPEKYLDADLVIIATTAQAVNFIKFSRPLPLWKRLSLNRLKYTNANKVFLKFRTPFWSQAENNLARPILYGDYPGKRAGGTGITDNLLEQVYYPSNPGHGPSLLASYTWDNNADKWITMNDTEMIDVVLGELEDIHGPVVREEYEEGAVYNWNKDKWSRGAFVMLEPYQKYNFKESLQKPINNIRFVGEYTNKYYNGWIEAAMESAVGSMINLAPTKFNERFGEAEREFFTRKDRNPSKK